MPSSFGIIFFHSFENQKKKKSGNNDKIYLIVAILGPALTNFVNERSESQHGGSSRVLLAKLQHMLNRLLCWVSRHSQSCKEHVATLMIYQVVADGMAHDFSASSGTAVRKSIVEVFAEEKNGSITSMDEAFKCSVWNTMVLILRQTLYIKPQCLTV